MPDRFYIIVSKHCNGHSGKNALGHEIHISRFILFDLLQKGLIDSNSIIVNLFRDRFFLYDKYFKNVITYNDYEKNKRAHIEEIDLTQYSNDFRNDQIEVFKNINYHYSHFQKTPFLMTCLNNVNFHNLTSIDICKNKFILIHTRTRINGNENKNLNSLQMTIDKIRSIKNVNIVVFSADLFSVDKLNIQKENIHFTDNLQTYSSFLNNENCELFISEWSGGGQLSQYFYTGKIIYYFDNYPSHDYEKNYINFQNVANEFNNIMNRWDFKNVTECERFYYKTLDQMLENLITFVSN